MRDVMLLNAEAKLGTACTQVEELLLVWNPDMRRKVHLAKTSATFALY